jgi:general secretion pathway protein G
MRRHRSGFTLIELLVVIAIIAALAALVAPNVFQQLGRSKVATAASQIALLSAALDTYRLDNDFYPTTEQGLESLRREPLSVPRPRNWNGPYLRKAVPLDPWGRPYVYLSPGENNPESFDLLSFGRDGKPGGTGEDAEIRSWD